MWVSREAINRKSSSNSKPRWRGAQASGGTADQVGRAGVRSNTGSIVMNVEREEERNGVKCLKWNKEKNLNLYCLGKITILVPKEKFSFDNWNFFWILLTLCNWIVLLKNLQITVNLDAKHQNTGLSGYTPRMMAQERSKPFNFEHQGWQRKS